MKTLKWYHYIIFGLVILLFLTFSCGKGGVKGFFCGGSDTLSVKVDTITVIEKADTVYVPKIIGVINTIYKPVYKTDTLESFEVMIEPADTAAILNRYYQQVYYSDTQRILQGTVIINDTVMENRIRSRGLVTDLKVQTIKETVTITAPKRVVVSYGFNYMARVNDPFYAGGISLGLKGKNDNHFILSTGITRGQGNSLERLLFQGHALFPIRLIKRN